MRYVMFTWVHPDDASAWEAWKDADKEADVSRHREWFGKHRERLPAARSSTIRGP